MLTARGRLARSSCGQDTDSCVCSCPPGQRWVWWSQGRKPPMSHGRLQLGPVFLHVRSATCAPGNGKHRPCGPTGWGGGWLTSSPRCFCTSCDARKHHGSRTPAQLHFDSPSPLVMLPRSLCQQRRTALQPPPISLTGTHRFHQGLQQRDQARSDCTLTAGQRAVPGASGVEGGSRRDL